MEKKKMRLTKTLLSAMLCLVICLVVPVTCFAEDESQEEKSNFYSMPEMTSIVDITANNRDESYSEVYHGEKTEPDLSEEKKSDKAEISEDSENKSEKSESKNSEEKATVKRDNKYIYIVSGLVAVIVIAIVVTVVKSKKKSI